VKSVWIFLAEGFEEAEAVIPWDLFKRAGYAVTSYGLKSKHVPSVRGITILADKVGAESAISEILPDLVFLPGGMPGAHNLSEDPLLIQLLNTVISKQKYIAAICAAPAKVLGRHGFLHQKHFTCFPGMETECTGGLWTDGEVVKDGLLFTSRGMGTAHKLAFEIIRFFSGDISADELEKKTLWS